MPSEYILLNGLPHIAKNSLLVKDTAERVLVQVSRVVACRAGDYLLHFVPSPAAGCDRGVPDRGFDLEEQVGRLAP